MRITLAAIAALTLVATTAHAKYRATQMEPDDINLSELADTLVLDADLTWTIGATEQMVMNKAVTDATADEALQINYTASDTTAATTGQYAVVITNAASTEGADGLLRMVNSDADDAVVAGLLFGGTGTFTDSIVLENGESISGATASTITFGRSDAGALTLTCKDTDATCALTVLPGGAAALILGGASTTAATVTVNATGTAAVVLPNGAIGALELDADIVDGTALADTITCDANFAVNGKVGASGAAGGTQTFTGGVGGVAAVDADGQAGGAVSITGGLGTVLNGAGANDGNGGDVVLLGGARGGATGTAVQGIVRVGAPTVGSTKTTNLLAVGGGFECDGAAVFDGTAAFNSTTTFQAGDIAAAEIANDVIDGAQLADILGLDTTTIGLKNLATGGVILNWHDYADTADDDMAHVVMTANCTDVGTAAEDCDFSIGVVEAGAAAETRINIDADGGIEIGSANTNSVSLTTSATGDAAIVLPVESVSAGEITNPVRSFSLPTGAFFNCTASAIVDWGNEADAHPDFVLVNSAGPVIAWDATGGSPDTSEVCATFTVPADWVSGGTFVFRVTQGAATVTELESLEVRLSIDGAALGAADEDSLANQTAVQTVTSAPAGTQAAGASVSVMFKQGNPSGDDTMNVLSVDYQYTASM